MAVLSSGRRALAGAVAVVLLVVGPAAAQSVGVGADDIKAAFLYNFAKYVTWPGPVASSAFELCAVADPAFVRSLAATVAGESIDGRPVRLHSPTTPAEAVGCRILYIGAGDVQQEQALLRSVGASPVLTVGEDAGFLSRGGVVVFVRDADRVRFDVNIGVAQRSGLDISSRMLRVARRVSSTGTP